MSGLIWLVLSLAAFGAAVLMAVKVRYMRAAIASRVDQWSPGRIVDARTDAAVLAAAAAVLAVLGVLGVLLDSSHAVAARGVMVQSRFGKVVAAPQGPGWHWVNPVNTVEEFDASVQTLKFFQGEKDDDGNCLTVRLGNNTMACVDVTAQWNINHRGDVNSLYLQYKTFANIHTNLVIRQLQSALNEVFGTYDPLQSIDSGTNRPAVTTKTLQDYVRGDLQRDLGTAISIDSVTIPIIHFDTATEDRLKAFQQALADTRIAAQQVATARQQADANNILSSNTATGNPGVQYQNCLNLILQLSKSNQLGGLPPTFNCGGSAAGTLIQTGGK